MRKITKLLFVSLLFSSLPFNVFAHHIDLSGVGDTDHDGLTDTEELKYGTNPLIFDTDGDSFGDGEEISHGYDPLTPGTARLPKRIDVNLTEQRLRFYYGEFGEQGNILISSGTKGYRTPTGNFSIQKKKPLVTYKGKGYFYPNTKWNLQFLPGYYIHGAYWHNNFGHPMSHGCINVSYSQMENLYTFADEGTVVSIHY